MIVIRHAKPVIEPAVPPAEWALSDEGATAAAALGQRLALRCEVRASTEPKAIATGEALAFGAVTVDERLGEVWRPWYNDAARLDADVELWFAGAALDGWEPRTDALARFDAAVESEPPVIVTHGTVLTAWLQSRGLVEDAIGFWRGLRQPDAWKVGAETRPRTLKRCP